MTMPELFGCVLLPPRLETVLDILALLERELWTDVVLLVCEGIELVL